MATFILPQDYDVLITDDQLTQVTTDPNNIAVCLLQSEEEVKEYLRHRFDVATDMRPVEHEICDSRDYHTARSRPRTFQIYSLSYWVDHKGWI